jgi:hypothetical protein
MVLLATQAMITITSQGALRQVRELQGVELCGAGAGGAGPGAGAVQAAKVEREVRKQGWV